MGRNYSQTQPMIIGSGMSAQEQEAQELPKIKLSAKAKRPRSMMAKVSIPLSLSSASVQNHQSGRHSGELGLCPHCPQAGGMDSQTISK